MINARAYQLVIIASRFGPTYLGGLAAYQRQIGGLLCEDGRFDVSFWCLEKHRTPLGSTQEVIPRPLRVLQKARFGNLGTRLFGMIGARPVLHRFAGWFAALLWPAGNGGVHTFGAVDHLHFVGTGWDLWGFALQEHARRIGTRFSILPAVHPGSWGDSEFDISFYKRADYILCLSEHERSFLESRGVDPRKLATSQLPPFCRSDGCAARFRETKHALERPIVLFMGRRDKGKGYYALLRAWKQVCMLVPEALLVVAGPGLELDPSIYKLPPSSVLDIGMPDELTKADALAACDMLCLPSADESFGLVYVEAWSYSKPVICGTAPACRELVEDMKDGIWSSEETSHLAGSLVMLLTQPLLAKRLGEAGHEKQQARFTLKAMFEAHLNCFQQKTA